MAKKKEVTTGDHIVRLLEPMQLFEGGRIFPIGAHLTVTPEREIELIELKQAEKI